jgi:hypothetical protein
MNDTPLMDKVKQMTSDNAADISGVVNHPRDAVVEKAGKELFDHITNWRRQHGLKPWEYTYILNVLMGRHAQEMCIVERGGE